MKSRTKTAVLNLESSMQPQAPVSGKKAALNFNSQCLDGALHSAGGIAEMGFNAATVCDLGNGTIYFRNDDGLYVKTADGTQQLIPHLPEIRCSLVFSAGKKAVALSVEGQTLAICDGETTSLCNKTFVSMCYCRNRLYGVTGTDGKVLFSSAEDFSVWNDDYIDFADGLGDVKAVATYDDCVYCFREDGLTKITPSAKKEDMKVETVRTAAPTPIPNTIALCGKVYYLSEQGLCSLDRNGVKRVFTELDGMFCDMSSATACAVGSKYYLCCKLNVEGSVTNAVLVADVPTESHTALTCGREAKIYGGTAVYYCTDDGVGNLAESGDFCTEFSEGFYKSPQVTFGNLNKKFLKSFTIKSDCDVFVAVEGFGKRKYRVAKGIVTVPTNLLGRTFTFTLRWTGGKVEAFSATCKIYDGEVSR